MGKAVDVINRVVAEAIDVPRTVCIQTIEHTMEPRVVLTLAIVLLHAVLVKENIWELWCRSTAHESFPLATLKSDRYDTVLLQAVQRMSKMHPSLVCLKPNASV